MIASKAKVMLSIKLFIAAKLDMRLKISFSKNLLKQDNELSVR